jgi:hypothetical protein
MICRQRDRRMRANTASGAIPFCRRVADAFRGKMAASGDVTGADGYPVKMEVVQGWFTSQGGVGHGRLSHGWTGYAVH